jgi:hypothetical protein
MTKTKSSKKKPRRADADAPSEQDVSDLEIGDDPEDIEEPADPAPLDDAHAAPKLSPQAAQEARLRRARLKAASRRR